MNDNENSLINIANKLQLGEKETCIDIAVNGTLMRGLEPEPNLLNVGATFVREELTEKSYRLFSIDDVHPAMIRLPAPGFEKVPAVSVAVEVWSVPLPAITTLLKKEPAGLSIGKVKLNDADTELLGEIAEPALVAKKKDISDCLGNGVANYRDYTVQEGMPVIDEELNKELNLRDERVTTVRIYRDLGQLLYRNRQLRRALCVMNHAVKLLGIRNRLYQNIPLGNATVQ